MAELDSLTDIEFCRFLATGDATVAAVSDDDLDTWINLAKTHILECAWAPSTREAYCYLALHYIASSPAGSGGNSGGTGPIASERVGQWARSYGVLSDINAANLWLSRTSYGQRLLQLAMSRAARAPIMVG